MIDELIPNILASLNLPIKFQTYGGVATTYITFFTYLKQGESFSEDTEELSGNYIQVDIWSKERNVTLYEQVKTLIIEAQFKRTDEVELYESDTKIYHKGIRFFYSEEII